MLQNTIRDASPSAPLVVDLTEDVRALAEAAIGAPHVERLLANALDWIARVAPYDLACVFELQGAVLRVRTARGRLMSPRVEGHTLQLQRFPSLRQALESGRGRAFTDHDHLHGDGDAFDGILDLPPGHSCMVIPLCTPGKQVGLLTLDREQCQPYSDATVRLVEVCGQLISLALENARQRELLDRMQLQQASFLEAVQGEQLPANAWDTYVNSQVLEVQTLVDRLRHFAPLSAPVLIQGETGVGKEVFARLVHTLSPRAKHPFVKVNCASIPENLLESELFGHVRGAFTGATSDRPGRFRTANGGTLFLDEIGEMPLSMQARLLRVLQEGEFEPVGSDRTLRVDVRILAATNVNLLEAIAARTFRADLYYRLSVFPVVVPPLRSRSEDLPLLARGLLARAFARNGRGPLELSPDALELLKRYPWPGNVRELANVLERASYLRGQTHALTAWHIDAALGPVPPSSAAAPAPTASPAHAGGSWVQTPPFPAGVFTVPSSPPAPPPAPTALPTAAAPLQPETSPPPRTLDAVERAEIIRTLRETRGRLYGQDGAASRLGLKPSTLQARMKKLGIDRLEAAAGLLPC